MSSLAWWHTFYKPSTWKTEARNSRAWDQSELGNQPGLQSKTLLEGPGGGAKSILP